MWSINYAAPAALTASLQCRPNKAIRAPQPTVRFVCGSHNGSATAYRVSDLEVVMGKSEKAQVTERGPGHVMTLAERMRVGGLMKDRFAYKECFVVRSYEVGSNKSATMETILNLIQKEDMVKGRGNKLQSCTKLGMVEGEFPTLPSMKKNRLIWMNCQMHVEINKYPGWGDVVEIEHWCEAEGRLTARFDYIMKNTSTGEVIGRATRLAFPEDNNKGLKKISKLHEPAEYSRLNLLPRRSDLNMNSHVNSVTYFTLLLESMPQDIIDTYELQSITIDYRHDCQFDDSLDSYTSSEIERDTLDGFSNDACLLTTFG